MTRIKGVTGIGWIDIQMDSWELKWHFYNTNSTFGLIFLNKLSLMFNPLLVHLLFIQMWLSHSQTFKSFPDPDDNSGTIKALSAAVLLILS